MTALMRRSIEDAVRYADGLKEALDQIFELHLEGEEPPAADMDRIERKIVYLAMDEGLADRMTTRRRR